MNETIDNFEILVRHGALCSTIIIEELCDAFKAMKPSLHRYCDEPHIVDVEALIYAIERLPATVHKVREVLVQSDVPDKLPTMAGVERVPSGARRRPTFQLGEDLVIVVAREGRTELLDLISLLTSYLIEARKIGDLLSLDPLGEELSHLKQPLTLAEHNRLLARLAFVLGVTDDLVVRLDECWNGELLQRVVALTAKPPSITVRLHRGYSVDASRDRARDWARSLQEAVERECGPDAPVHLLSSNTHSTVNLLSGYANCVTDEVWEWARANKLYDDELTSLGSQRPENITYFLLRDWLRAFPERKQEKRDWETLHGIFNLDDAHHVGVEAQVLNLASLPHSRIDSRLHLSADSLKNDAPVLINFDYAFGEQAGILVEQLFRQFGHRIASFSIMGKAGTVVGRRGGIMLPSYLLRGGSRDIYDLPFGNALTAQDLDGLKMDEIHAGGPMLTVAGTIMQNDEMLEEYRDEWGVLGLEMEGIPYVRALHQCQKLGLTRDQLDVAVGYYASDAPLVPGESLSRELSFEGLNATYALNIAILHRILGRGETQETREDLPMQTMVESSIAEKGLGIS